MEELFDFYDFVKTAKNQQEKSFLLRRWHGDPALDLRNAPSIVRITPGAFWKSRGGCHSLEHIFTRARKLHREIAFTGLIDEKRLTVLASIKGVIGDYGGCDWWEGSLMAKSFAIAKQRGLKVMLGHTHPAGYGAVCSDVYDRNMLSFGTDYMEIWAAMCQDGTFSRFHIIMSPREKQIGIFELKKNGVVIFHPWKIGK